MWWMVEVDAEVRLHLTRHAALPPRRELTSDNHKVSLSFASYLTAKRLSTAIQHVDVHLNPATHSVLDGLLPLKSPFSATLTAPVTTFTLTFSATARAESGLLVLTGPKCA